jgi:gamma-tubulin complex component 3
LHDPFNEFFVQVNPETAGQHFGRAALRDDMGFGYGGDISSRHDIAYTLWEKRYIFRKEMLPTFLNEDFGKKVCGGGQTPPQIPDNSPQLLAITDILHRQEYKFHSLWMSR